MRRARINIVTVLLILVLGAVGIFAWLFGPYYWDKQVMNEVARTSALEWYATENRQKGMSRLGHLLEKRGLSEYIYPNDCTFQEEGELRVVACWWEVDVFYPGSEMYRTLSFDTTVEVDRRGDAVQY